MKKLCILTLAVVLVLGMGTLTMASHGTLEDGAEVSDTAGITIDVGKYAQVGFDEGHYEDELFEKALKGKPGVYISDGGATKDKALDHWGSDLEVVAEEGQLPNPHVAFFQVLANTDVDISIHSDFGGWLKSPTLFIVSSDEDDINGIGSWQDNLAMIGNETGEDYENSFPVDYGTFNEKGRLDFHVNGAIWIQEIAQQAADTYTTEIQVTVAAQ